MAMAVCLDDQVHEAVLPVAAAVAPHQATQFAARQSFLGTTEKVIVKWLQVAKR